MAALDGFHIPSTVLKHFDLTSTPWSSPVVDQIQRRRQVYPDEALFYDRLLEVGGLDGRALYPPSTPAAVRRLLASIDSCNLERLHQDCLYYYLLKDYDEQRTSTGLLADQDTEERRQDQADGGVAGGFARRRCLPKNWTLLMDGYWALDKGDWQRAVNALSSPSLSGLNFLPEILSVLASLVPTTNTAASLIHKLLTTAERPLTTPEEEEIKLLALSSAAGLMDTFTWIRQQEEPPARRLMRESVWCWALGSPKIPLGAAKPELQTSSLRELLHLPLSDEENDHLVHFLSHPPRSISPQALSVLHDLVFLRMVHQGRYAEVIQLDRDLAGSGGREADRQRRREMIREFISILPEVQRKALLADSELRAAERDKEQAGFTAEAVDHGEPDVEMPASWLATNGFTTVDEVMADATELARPSVVLELARGTALPASPSQPLPRPASPFTGPPRFASSSSFGLGTPGSPASPALRVASNSPFATRHASVGSRRMPSMPRPPRRIVDDDADPAVVQRSATLSRGTPGASAAQSAVPATRNEQRKETPATQVSAHTDSQGAGLTALEEQPSIPETGYNLRRSTRRVVSSTSQRQASAGDETTPETSAPATAEERHKTPPPPSPQTKRRSTRHTPGPSAGSSGLPGSFPETVPEDAVPEIQPTPRRPNNSRPPPSTSRQRMTRSASLASLADGEQTPAPKRTRRTAGSRAGSLAPTEPDEGAQSVRRSTRRATSTKPSDRGSPTPSAAGKAAREKKAAKASNQTPRTARAKKA